MNLDDDWDWDDQGLELRPWGESRWKIALAGLVPVLTLAFLWKPVVDAWHIARAVSFSPEISDDWQF